MPDLNPDDFADQETYAIAAAEAAIADPDQEYICGSNGSVQTEYAIEPDRCSHARDRSDELVHPIECLPDYRNTARIITRKITYGPWRYVTPEEIRNG